MLKKSRWVQILVLVGSLVGQGCQTANKQWVTDRVNSTASLSKPYVVLVSLDGFRSDYLKLYSPPFLNQLKSEGASAENLIPVYPSKTFTNHLSIITGLYAENHGIVANSFYDPARNETYSLADRKKVADSTWYGGEPIWVTAEKQGMLSAAYFWPGSEAPIGGMRPTYYYEFNKTTEPEIQTAQVLKWLKLSEEKRPHLITMYFHHVDTAGHHFGPDSTQVKDAVLKVDQALAGFYRDLQALNLPIHLVVVSDHGMQALDPSKMIYLEDMTQLGDSKFMGDGPMVMVYASSPVEKNRIYSDLKKAENHFKVYRREELPAEDHLSKTPRAGDLVIIPEAPYSVFKTRREQKFEKGAHGYDPQTTLTMRAVFLATGPKVRQKLEVKPFRNIHIFPFLAKILQLDLPKKIDGDGKVLAPALN